MSVITLSFMQRFMENLDTAIKTFVEEKLTPITETMENTTPDLMIRAGESIETGADVNDMTTKGIFYITSDSDASEIAHLPIEKSGKFIVAETGVGLVQIFIVDESASLYIRTRISSIWTAWARCVTESDLLPKIPFNSENGEYTLKANITDGNVSYFWSQDVEALNTLQSLNTLDNEMLPLNEEASPLIDESQER